MGKPLYSCTLTGPNEWHSSFNPDLIEVYAPELVKHPTISPEMFTRVKVVIGGWAQYIEIPGWSLEKGYALAKSVFRWECDSVRRAYQGLCLDNQTTY